MINLLPIDKKAEIRAARTNLILVRYIAILLMAITFILGSMYVTYTVLALTKASSEDVIASNDLRAGVYSSTKSQVDALSASLAQTKLLLNEEVRYSKVFINIAQLMPAGTVFGKIALDNTSFGGVPIITKVYAKTSADVVALRQNFEKSPMFTGVKFQTIIETGSSVEGYPVSADITFTINKAVAQ
ncbi:MAG: Fimbrial assembly family protein [Candidatus Saccharibacteria bacterium]|nr:Fimbrial assembly family protein [Candidatus Saccharibacteria bacterium]MDB5180567.1 Fimbrial assembly family protein [Candidatus Saccharibacteria bacterium]